MSKPIYCTADGLSQEILERYGIPISAERLTELADLGYIPSCSCDGNGPYFRRGDAVTFPRELAETLA